MTRVSLDQCEQPDVSSAEACLSIRPPSTPNMLQEPGRLWQPGDEFKWQGSGQDIHHPDIFKTIESSVDALSKDLRTLSLDISGLQNRLLRFPRDI